MYPKHLYISVRLGLQEREKKIIKKKKFTSLNCVVDRQQFFSRKQDQVVQKSRCLIIIA